MLKVYTRVLWDFIDGLLEGRPKVLHNTSYEFLKQQDGYFIGIKTIELNNALDFPSISKVNEEGVRDFTNDMDNEIVCIGVRLA